MVSQSRQTGFVEVGGKPLKQGVVDTVSAVREQAHDAINAGVGLHLDDISPRDHLGGVVSGKDQTSRLGPFFDRGRSRQVQQREKSRRTHYQDTDAWFLLSFPFFFGTTKK
jgi:hypothetical protein